MEEGGVQNRGLVSVSMILRALCSGDLIPGVGASSVACVDSLVIGVLAISFLQPAGGARHRERLGVRDKQVYLIFCQEPMQAKDSRLLSQRFHHDRPLWVVGNSYVVTLQKDQYFSYKRGGKVLAQ